MGLAAALAGDVRGWRHDGTNTFPGSLSALDVAAPDLRTALPAWSNASPVVLSTAICFTAEPTTLGCAELATGRVLWTGTNDVLDTFAPDAREPLRQQVREAEAASERLDAAHRAYSAVRRAARADPAAEAEVARLAEEITALRATIDAVAWFLTPPDREIIGYASATPVSDGQRVFALFGNGVVSAWTIDGRRLWSRWLGPHRTRLRGYDVGTAASPALAGGRLVIPWERLVALDPSTGATVWDAGAWMDYGSPAATSIGGVGIVLTPDGRLLRARDGATLQSGLGDLWYVGPVTRGDVAWFVGGAGSAHRSSTHLAARALRLVHTAADRVEARPMWTTPVDLSEPLYSPPVASPDRLYLATSAARLLVLDAATGARLTEIDMRPHVGDTVYASPILVGTSLIVGGASGRVVHLDTATLTPRSAGRTQELRATPVWDGRRLWLRTAHGLSAVPGR